jgi:signal transduction histidine kinase
MALSPCARIPEGCAIAIQHDDHRSGRSALGEPRLPGYPRPAALVTDDEHSRVTRERSGGRTVIRKEPLGPASERRLRHERAILERLRGAAGVAQLVEAPPSGRWILMADAGERTLAEAAKPLPVDELISMAPALARAVAAVHRRGVMHRDIAPGNVVLSDAGEPCLVGFGLAMSPAEIRPEFTHHAEIVGTLAYVAPEQTGRTGRSVDQRADLYALGATLYELATGAPPFGTGDPLRLTHDHLARVPTPPSEVNAAVPPHLSQIVMHLLEKEPDDRYQSAEGLVYDLERLRAGAAAGALSVGEHDVATRLLPPSRLVGRDAEVAALEAAFADALSGRCSGVLVSGAPGVGKTALVDQLRTVVTSADGWFVAGKFDQYRRDLEFDAIQQVLRALGRLLLAEPDAELADVRERILRAVGPNAGLLTMTVPEFAALLGVPPDAGDPLTAQARAQLTAAHVLRAVASPERPLVAFVDDLQWGARTPLGAIDSVLRETPADGLLLVGAYRDGDMDPVHPLAASLARWRDEERVRHVVLANLPAPSLVEMVSDVLHVDAAASAELVDVIEPRTSGNPYESVELLDALRRDGLLTPSADGWRWEPAAVRARLAHPEAGGPLAAPVESLPADARRMLEEMACLGGQAELSVLQAATGEPADVVERRLAHALDEGLLVTDAGSVPAVRFRHDQIREGILRGLSGEQREAVHLAIARRLAPIPELFAVAAEHYLPVVDALEDPVERQAAAELLARAADQAALIGSHALVDALLEAALRLVEPGQTDLLIKVHTARHAALFSLGRFEEADEDYRAIEALSGSAMERAGAAAVQAKSLTHRGHWTAAIELGTGAAAELGIRVPGRAELPGELDRHLETLFRWLEETDDADEPPAPGAPPTLAAVGPIFDAMLGPAFLVGDGELYAWLALEALRLWTVHGPVPELVGPAANAAFQFVAARRDYVAAYRAARRILLQCEARGYDAATAAARHIHAVLIYWVAPAEVAVAESRRARDGLIACADLADAGWVTHGYVSGLLDCAPTLDGLVDAVDEALAFARRTGDQQGGQWLDSYQWLVAVLRGGLPAMTDEDVAPDRYAGDPLAVTHAYISRAVAAAIFGDATGMARHTRGLPSLQSARVGFSISALAAPLRGLSLAWEARGRAAAEREELLAELDDVMRTLAARAADAPDNFLHLLRLVEAERAWTAGDFRAGAVAFDAALREVAGRRRPWHRALIAERAGRFQLAHGVEHAGYELLAEARHEYLAWGANAKVDALDWAYPMLRPDADAGAAGAGEGPSAKLAPRRGAVTTGTIDLLGILSASQALSSETSFERVRARVVEVLCAMTGATGVHLLLWSDERRQWLVAEGGGSVPVTRGDHEDAVPLSVLRYAERVREPLVVADALSDDRFARDPYFAHVEHCSLLTVPVFSRGALRATLILENRLIRGAFSADRLDAVELIAGQLAVSLDNAELYAELAGSRTRIVAAGDDARRRIERDLHDGAQQRLVHSIVTLKLARRALEDTPAKAAAQLADEALESAVSALDEIRELARGIHPRILSSGGLGPALETLRRRSRIPVALDVRTGGRLPEPVEVTAYFVVCESLANAAKHADAASIRVLVDMTDDHLRLSISDDGVGGADPGRGSGLVGLKDRVEALGGTLTVASRANQGTLVSVELPLDCD